MADWVWVESAGTQLEEEPRTKSVKFGDGYEQRSPDGINFMPQVHEVAFDGVDDAVADEMIAFLRQHQGHIAFSYVPLRETVAQRVICRRWTRTAAGVGESTVRARFEQIFEP